MKKVLWLASWYPNKISPLNGDFIQRHAEAVAVFEPVHVIYVVKDEYSLVTNHITVENFIRENLSESIAYYKPFKTGIRSFDKAISMVTYFKIYQKLIFSFIKNNRIPKLVHVHVAMRAGILAMWLKNKYRIPYLVTEHWTGYHKNAIENIYNKGFIFKRMSKLILKNAELILPDSHQLGKCIHDNIFPVKFLHVSNVVDTHQFNSSDYNRADFTFIHVSSMNPQKNVEGLLRAFARLLSLHYNCRLIIVGNAYEHQKKKAKELKLDNHIDWKGTLTYKEVAEAMKRSSALLMFSKYENQPCVILEALCCGLPVISTNVGGISEVINKDNGILINPENEEQLLQAMIAMIDDYKHFDKLKISETAKRNYNYETIGKKVSELYNSYRP